MEAKKVFISYSWGTKDHQDWVQNFGTRLMSDGIDVTLDRWSAREGHDISFFMETMVKKDLYDKVLIISDKNYSNKANDRNGGVGIEAQIITPEIYGNMTQEKFLPIVVERDEDDKPYLPTFLRTKLYFDFSKEEYFEESYENLVRNIYDAPQIVKPQLGKAPSYVTEQQSITNNKTSFFIRSLEHNLSKNPLRINILSKEFIEMFSENLYDFKLNFGGGYNVIDAGKSTVDKIHEYKPMREDLISFLLIVTRTEYNLDSDIIKSLFELKEEYSHPKESDQMQWYPSDYEHFKFIFHELFIYVIAIGLRNQNYDFVAELLHGPYFFENRYRKEDVQKFVEIRDFPRILNEYYEKEFRKISGSADLMITNLSPQIAKKNFIQADLLLHFIDELYNNETTSYKKWFPVTYFYKMNENISDLFARLLSLKHFEKLKSVFGVESKEELQKILSEYKNKNEKDNRQNPRFSSNPWNHIPFIYELVKIEEIGTYK